MLVGGHKFLDDGEHLGLGVLCCHLHFFVSRNLTDVFASEVGDDGDAVDAHSGVACHDDFGHGGHASDECQGVWLFRQPCG